MPILGELSYGLVATVFALSIAYLSRLSIFRFRVRHWSLVILDLEFQLTTCCRKHGYPSLVVSLVSLGPNLILSYTSFVVRT